MELGDQASEAYTARLAARIQGQLDKVASHNHSAILFAIINISSLLLACFPSISHISHAT